MSRADAKQIVVNQRRCVPLFIYTHRVYGRRAGTSVVGIKYRDGVMIACDTLAAYGSTKRYKSVTRLFRVNDSCVVAAGGEISDFQYIQKLLDELTTGAAPCLAPHTPALQPFLSPALAHASLLPCTGCLPPQQGPSSRLNGLKPFSSHVDNL